MEKAIPTTLERKSPQLSHENDNLLTPRDFAREAKLRQAASRGIDSFLGAGDRAFLNHQAIDGCFPTPQSTGGLMPLQRAIEIGDVRTLEMALVSKNANLVTETCNAFGETLLHTAVLHYQLEAVRLLLHHGASPLAKLPDKANLQTAETTLESLAPRCSNFRYNCMLDAAGATPLHYACAVGQLDMLELFLSYTSSLKDMPKRWRPGSLLLWAIASGQSNVVEFLVLQSHLEADCFDEDGNNSMAIAVLVLATPETPARLATLKTILQALLQRDVTDGGADINHKNMHGFAAFDVAESPASKHILAQLGARTARIVSVEQVLRWDRDRYREEFEHLPLPGCRRLKF